MSFLDRYAKLEHSKIIQFLPNNLLSLYVEYEAFDQNGSKTIVRRQNPAHFGPTS